MAMHKLLSQTRCPPQSTPATPTHPHFLLSSLHKQQPVADPTHLPSVSTATQRQRTPPAPLLPTSQNFTTTASGFSRASVTPIAVHSSPLTTAMSQIPTSLQRLVHANLSATHCTVQQPLPSSHPSSRGPSPAESSHSSPQGRSPASSSSPASTNTTGINTRPVPLSINPTTVFSGKQSDDLGPTPLTPLSPFCGQQGK